MGIQKIIQRFIFVDESMYQLISDDLSLHSGKIVLNENPLIIDCGWLCADATGYMMCDIKMKLVIIEKEEEL